MKRAALKTTFVVLVAAALLVLITAPRFTFLRSSAARAEVSKLDPVEFSILKSMENLDWMTEGQVNGIVEHAMGYESAVILCHSEWNMTSLRSRPNFAKLAAGYHEAYPEQKIGFHYLDLTQVTSTPLNRIPGTEGKQLPAYSHLIWLRDGHFVKGEFLYISEDIGELIEMTRNITTRVNSNVKRYE